MAKNVNSWTVQDIIDQLSDMDPKAQIRLATQPRYPFEHRIGDIVEVQEEDGRMFVYIGEGTQLDYLSKPAREALDW